MTGSHSTPQGGPLPAPMTVPFQSARRWLFLALVSGTTLFGSWIMLWIVGASGHSWLEVVILALFVPTFGWISIPFWNAVIGFTLQLLERDALSLRKIRPTGSRSPAIHSRTALVMPARNEDPRMVMEGLGSTLQSLIRAGCDQWFDFFLLSDSDDPEIIALEEAAWAALRSRAPRPDRLIYRRRPHNTSRKAGNLADFCERWGDSYDFMVVLDSDSIMSAETLVELVQAMEADPEAGLIQTVPVPARQRSLFGRLLQFAACLHAPTQAMGQAFWQGDAANYWGHNAILRIGPFRRHCTLPVLPGRPPLGGEVLSHDFVEAALLRRAGWSVYLLTRCGGSFEQVPENLVDYSLRDRRWAQGSLQHLRLMSLPGLRRLSRVHFALGAMGYLSSVLWFFMLLAGSAYVTLAEVGGSGRLGSESALLAEWLPAGRPPVPLLAVTAVLLFLPKGLSLALSLLRHRERFGGAAALLLSALVEVLFSVLMAPVLMIYHTRFVLGILTGRTVSWEGGSRERRESTWGTAWRRTAGVWLIGVVWAAATLYVSWTFLLWLSPILIGLLLAPALVRWTSLAGPGEWMREAGLLVVESETDPSHIAHSTDGMWALLRPVALAGRRNRRLAQEPLSTGTPTIDPYSVQEPS